MDFGRRSARDVMGRIYPECHSSSNREGRRKHRKRTEEFLVEDRGFLIGDCADFWFVAERIKGRYLALFYLLCRLQSI